MKRFVFRDLDGQVFLLIEPSYKRAKREVERVFRVNQSEIVTYDKVPLGQWIAEDVWIPQRGGPSQKGVLVIDGDGSMFWVLSQDKDTIRNKIVSSEGLVRFFELSPGKVLLVVLNKMAQSLPFDFARIG